MKLRKSGHPHIKVILAYYRGCNTQDFDLMMSTFTPDIVHYFVDHSAVVGANALIITGKVAPKTHANWRWITWYCKAEQSLNGERWQPQQTDEAEILRGTEWYVFKDERISEIRSYHCNYYLNAPENRELHDFDYAERGYRQL